MAIGNPTRKTTPLGVFVMLFALVIAAFLGGAVGLFFQNTDLLDEEVEEEVVTAQQPNS